MFLYYHIFGQTREKYVVLFVIWVSMTYFPRFIENTMIGENLDGSEHEDWVSVYSHRQQIRASGIAAVSVASTARLQLVTVTMVLNSNDVGMSSAEKERMRQGMLTQQLHNERSCQGLIRMTPYRFKILYEKLKDTGILKN